MQCARCAAPLADDVQFCRVCGFPVTKNPPVFSEMGMSPQVSGAPAPGASQGTLPPVTPNFGFQEFAGPAPALPAAPPGWAGPASMPPVAPEMYAPPSAPMPPVAPGMYAPPPFPVQPARPVRRGRSVGWIVLYAFLAILVVFVGLGVTLYFIGSHAIATSAANQAAQSTAAMQLYQQVTSKKPSLEDPMNAPALDIWSTTQQTDYGCSMQNDGLHAYIKDTNEFFQCLNFSSFASSTDIAFQVDMQILSGDGGGLLFREATIGGGFYYFEVDLGGFYRVFVDKNPSATPSQLAGGTADTTIALGNDPVTLTLIAKGSLFDFYINQQFVTQVQDSTFPAGNIGIIASENTDPTEVVYTNAKIWDLDS